LTVVDIHTHLFWYPDHIDAQTATESLASKLVKLEQSGGRAHLSSRDLHSNDARPEGHLEATRAADRVVVFGLYAPQTGFSVPNEVIADHVRRHRDRMEGWASINPADDDALEQLEHCVEDLGLRGVKLGPAYQHWDPRDTSLWPFFERVEKLDLPVMIHQATTYPTRARIEWAKPLQLEPLVMAFPDMRMILAHMGHPWEEDAIALVRKAPQVYTDISALHFRPWRFWQAMVTAMEYGISHKILFGSDFPNASTADTLDGLRRVNDIVEGTRFPRFPEDAQERIVHENWKRFLGEDW
jgi:predicted TIM-barrel fold metal-dependent hydrolase